MVSIAGGHTVEYVALANGSTPSVDLIEVNISCPNVESRGQVFACDPIAAGRVISAVRRAAHPNMPVFAKLSPDVTDIGLIARAVTDAGADGISLINTLLGLEIDLDTLRPALGGVTGGLSGPAVRPVALRCVWQVHQAVPHMPLLGMGGIMTGDVTRAALPAGRRLGGLGRHCGLSRPDGPGPDPGRAGSRARCPRVRLGGRGTAPLPPRPSGYALGSEVEMIGGPPGPTGCSASCRPSG